MTTIKAPPIYENLTETNGKATLPYILFFDSLFKGDSGQAWTPTFTNLTVVGAAPTITGALYRIGRSLAYFSVKVTPGAGGNTSAVAGTTYVNNFPLSLKGDGACLAVSGLLGSSAGMCDQASNKIYVPAWSTVTVPITVVGFVEAS